MGMGWGGGGGHQQLERTGTTWDLSTKQHILGSRQ